MSQKQRTDARVTHPKPVSSAKSLRYRITPSRDLKPGESIKFLLPVRGTDEECFLINFRGEFHAYVNRCRHVPIAMDWVENQFFAERGRYLLCQTHNACYDPATGKCLAGPQSACGKFLFRIPIEIKDGVVYARPPDEAIDPGVEPALR